MPTVHSTSVGSGAGSGAGREDGGGAGGKVWLFDGSNRDEFPGWRRWAEAYLLDLPESKSKGLSLFKLLRGHAREVLHAYELTEFQPTGGRAKIWAELNARFPQKT